MPRLDDDAPPAGRPRNVRLSQRPSLLPPELQKVVAATAPQCTEAAPSPANEVLPSIACLMKIEQPSAPHYEALMGSDVRQPPGGVVR